MNFDFNGLWDNIRGWIREGLTTAEETFIAEGTRHGFAAWVNNVGTAGGEQQPGGDPRQPGDNFFRRFMAFCSRNFIKILLWSIILSKLFLADTPPHHPNILPTYKGNLLITSKHSFPIGSLVLDDDTLLWSTLMQALPEEIKNEQGEITFVTQRALRLRLPDSTLVCLGPFSRLTLSPLYGWKQRHLVLEGEAVFYIFPYRNQLLSIRSDEQLITIDCAVINVTAYKDANYQAALIDGTISVHLKTRYDISSPGQAIVFDRATGKAITKLIDPYAVSSWHNEECYMFVNKPLSEVINHLERWHGIDIETENSLTAYHPYTGCINMKLPLIKVLEGIQRTDRIEFRFDNRGRVYVTMKE